MSENPDNFALRTFSSAAELREFYHHFMPVHCTERFLFRNKNIAGKSPVVRHDKAEALPALEGSDQLVAAPLCNLQYLSLPAFARRFSADCNFYGIPVQCALRLGLRNIYILLLSLCSNKAEAAGRPVKKADPEIGIPGPVAPAAIHRELPLVNQLVQQKLERFALLARHNKECRQLLQAHRPVIFVLYCGTEHLLSFLLLSSVLLLLCYPVLRFPVLCFLIYRFLILILILLIIFLIFILHNFIIHNFIIHNLIFHNLIFHFFCFPIFRFLFFHF